jgi:hypothetical protein
MSQKIYGNNKVFCKGRFISGPDARSCVISVMMVLVPSIVWQAMIGPFFAIQSSVLVPIVGIILQIGSLAFMVATSLSDPGIMPHQKDYAEHYDSKNKVFRTKVPPRYYDLILRGHPFRLKFCTTCNIYRPPRCTHCSVCENCIERFDHHCPWIGNCVGKRNYWLFYSFVSLTGTLNVFVLATSIAHLVLLCQLYRDEGQPGGDAFVRALKEQPLSAVLAVYSVGIVWFTFGLCMYHNYLVATNQTTYEQIKGTYSSGNNPFDRGIFGNYVDVLLSRVRPRYFNPFTGRLTWPPPKALSSKMQPRLMEDMHGTDAGQGVSEFPAASKGSKEKIEAEMGASTQDYPAETEYERDVEPEAPQTPPRGHRSPVPLETQGHLQQEVELQAQPPSQQLPAPEVSPQHNGYVSCPASGAPLPALETLALNSSSPPPPPPLAPQPLLDEEQAEQLAQLQLPDLRRKTPQPTPQPQHQQPLPPPPLSPVASAQLAE